MVQSAETFRKNAIESRLLTAEEIDYALADLPPNQYPENGEKLARELMKRKLLTSYQAQELYAGRIKTLVLGNYVVIEKIGQGGMGLVLKARHRLMKRLAAIKILPAAAAKDAEAIARFRREFFAAGQLQHANIVTAYDAAESNGAHYLAMEYVDGKDLASYVKATGPMDVAIAMHCILQAAKGLEYAHRQGVIHRDIKPHNLLIDGDGNVKILDMGLARFEALAGAPSTELTNTGAIMGTVDYMAPEQAMNTKHADGRSDIYSLGATLWFLLTGQAMYDGDSLMARLLAHRDLPIPSLEARCPSAPRALIAIFERMVAKTPAARYSIVSEVIADLEPLVAGKYAEESGLDIESLDRDPRLLAFFANMEAEKRTKVLAAPLIEKSEPRDQTVAISGPLADTRQLASARPKFTVGLAAANKRQAANRTLPLMIVVGVGGIGLVGITILIVILNFPARKIAQSPPIVGPEKAATGAPQIEKVPATPTKNESSPNTAKVESPSIKESPKNETPAGPPNVNEADAPKSAVDLLAMVSPQKRFSLPSNWRFESGELTSSATGSIQNLKIIPMTKFHYRVECEMTLVSQGDAFYIVLPLGDAQIHWAANAYTKANVDGCRRGFASIGGKDLRTSAGSREVARFIVGDRHRVKIEVQVSSDQVRLLEQFDEESTYEWKGAKSEVSVPASYDWPEKEMLGCGVVNSVYRIHELAMTPLE